MAYGNLRAQRSMALDATRNDFYDRALARHVTSESVVLDLGAGIGIFGLLALKHGARRVYCVEPQDVGALSTELAAANGWADRLTFIQGRIEEVELPEEVDIIVSAMTGNLLFNEDLLPTVLHARDRYLREDGVLIPSAAAIDAAPVTAPALVESHLEPWGDDHLGIDVRPGRRYAANGMVLRDPKLREAGPLGPTTTLVSIELDSAEYEALDATETLVVDGSGTCHGVAAWLRLRLGEDWLSTGPFDPTVHWSPALIPFDPPLEVAEGEEMTLRLLRRPFGDWAWRVRFGSELRQGSTFFARPRSRAVAMAGADTRPLATRRAEAVAAVIAAMNGERTIEAIARQVAGRYEDLFGSSERALRFVRNVARHHGRPND